MVLFHLLWSEWVLISSPFCRKVNQGSEDQRAGYSLGSQDLNTHLSDFRVTVLFFFCMLTKRAKMSCISIKCCVSVLPVSILKAPRLAVLGSSPQAECPLAVGNWLRATPCECLDASLLGHHSGDSCGWEPPFPPLSCALQGQGPPWLQHWTSDCCLQRWWGGVWPSRTGLVLGPLRAGDISPGGSGGAPMSLCVAQAQRGLHLQQGGSWLLPLGPGLSCRVQVASTHVASLGGHLESLDHTGRSHTLSPGPDERAEVPADPGASLGLG